MTYRDFKGARKKEPEGLREGALLRALHLRNVAGAHGSDATSAIARKYSIGGPTTVVRIHGCETKEVIVRHEATGRPFARLATESRVGVCVVQLKDEVAVCILTDGPRPSKT